MILRSSLACHPHAAMRKVFRYQNLKLWNAVGGRSKVVDESKNWTKIHSLDLLVLDELIHHLGQGLYDAVVGPTLATTKDIAELEIGRPQSNGVHCRAVWHTSARG